MRSIKTRQEKICLYIRLFGFKTMFPFKSHFVCFFGCSLDFFGSTCEMASELLLPAVTRTYRFFCQFFGIFVTQFICHWSNVTQFVRLDHIHILEDGCDRCQWCPFWLTRSFLYFQAEKPVNNTISTQSSSSSHFLFFALHRSNESTLHLAFIVCHIHLSIRCIFVLQSQWVVFFLLARHGKVPCEYIAPVVCIVTSVNNL